MTVFSSEIRLCTAQLYSVRIKKNSNKKWHEVLPTTVMQKVHLTNVKTVLTVYGSNRCKHSVFFQIITLLLGNENVNVEEDNWKNTPHYRVGWSDSESLTKLDFMLVPLQKAPQEIASLNVLRLNLHRIKKITGFSGWRRPLRFRWLTFTHLFQSQLR